MTEQAARALGQIPQWFEAWYDEDDDSWIFHDGHGDHSVCVYASGRVVLLHVDLAVKEIS